jgi:SAM-dependent methyltransferase
MNENSDLVVDDPSSAFRRDIERYYRDTLQRHGDCAKGVDWKDDASRLLRLNRILDLFPEGPIASVLDVGCGTGALVEPLRARYRAETRYFGIDFVHEMVDAARVKHPRETFLVGGLEAVPERCDVVCASGVFNVRQNADEAAWAKFVFNSVEQMFGHCERACIFNILTSVVDWRIDRLYYSDVAEMWAWCVPRLTRHARLDHSYPLFEYTLALYRQPQ